MGFFGDFLDSLCKDLGLQDLADEIGRGTHEAITGSSHCNPDVGIPEEEEKPSTNQQ